MATIALYTAGFRAFGTGHHWTTFHALPEVMGTRAQVRADYLDNCCSKRNVTDYDRVGEISQREAEEILAEVRAFRGDLLDWLKRNHPTLWPEGAK